MKETRRELDTRPYHAPVLLVITNDSKKLCKIASKRLCCDFSGFTEDYKGKLLWNSEDLSKGIIISFRKNSGYGTIAHECFHAARFIVEKYAGITLSDDSEEAFAYMISELVDQILEI